MPGFEPAWVLVFNPGKDNEDVCVDHSQNGPRSVIAFETTHDAERFAQILQAEGLELATPLCWETDQLTSFCRRSGLEVTYVPRGELPAPSNNNNPRGDPERKYPGDGSGRPDAYMAHRPRLEELLGRTPDNCGDDDCTAPEDELAASPHQDGTTARDLLRSEAVAAIESILASSNATMDLTMLMRSAWEKVKADAHEQPSTDDEADEAE